MSTKKPRRRIFCWFQAWQMTFLREREVAQAFQPAVSLPDEFLLPHSLGCIGELAKSSMLEGQ